ncbi:glyoxalase [Roseovarius sp. SYSU LYC5161]|uniref:glyoxalase n=1 Tax=Roseovarius halophilus (ex Wu et al. 2025) TaxID=3376060 RepID=UPI0039996F62
MDYETVTPAAFGAAQSGFGLNILVRDVPAQVDFLAGVFEMQGHRVSRDFAILVYHGHVLQLHGDHTYGANPLLGLLPETPPRGAGAEFRLFHTDPDTAARRAAARGAHVLQPPTDKPHGLRETFILCDNGYAWVASRPLQQHQKGPDE